MDAQFMQRPVSGQDRTAEEADVGGNTWFMGVIFAKYGLSHRESLSDTPWLVYEDRNGP
jgi:hypothetical protein